MITRPTFGYLYPIRHRIALLFDRVFRRSCWAESAAWAMAYSDCHLRRSSACHRDPGPVGCWCGKFGPEKETRS